MAPREFYFDLTTGSIPNFSDDHKFGRNITVGTTQEAITTAGVYRMPTALTSLEVVSTSDNDGAGLDTGATKVRVEGIGPDWEEISEEVELNGLTPVAMVNQFYRVYRVFISESNIYATETQGSHLGNIIIREAGAGQIWADVDNVAIFARGQSQIAAFTVPKGKIAYVRNTFIYVDSNKTCNVVFYQREKANIVTPPYPGIFKVHIEFDGVKGEADYTSEIPMGPFAEYTDLVFMGTVDTGTAAVAVHFDIVLVEDDNQ